MENRAFDMSKIQATAEKLKADYQLKTQQLYGLRTELSHLKDRADCYKNELAMKENICNEKVKQLQGKLLQLRKDLETCTSKLNSLPVEESKEHRCLKCLREQWNGFLKQAKCCNGQTEPSTQSLYSALLDLDFDHVQNCRLKEEMENNLNQAKRQLSKLQRILSNVSERASDENALLHKSESTNSAPFSVSPFASTSSKPKWSSNSSQQRGSKILQTRSVLWDIN